MLIRHPTLDELFQIQQLELAAGAIFHTVDMAEIAEDDPPSRQTLERYLDLGQIWVVLGSDRTVQAYLMLDRVDGCAHIEQVSVAPAAQGAGLGRALIAHAGRWAGLNNLPALTLTTFAEVPWNAPYYQRLGFVQMADDMLSPGLVQIRAQEQAAGLDRWPRVCMQKVL